jgi:hypothetical protein
VNFDPALRNRFLSLTQFRMTNPGSHSRRAYVHYELAATFVYLRILAACRCVYFQRLVILAVTLIVAGSILLSRLSARRPPKNPLVRSTGHIRA